MFKIILGGATGLGLLVTGYFIYESMICESDLGPSCCKKTAPAACSETQAISISCCDSEAIPACCARPSKASALAAGDKNSIEVIPVMPKEVDGN